MKLTVRDMTYIALGAALIAVCSWISIPTTVPFTLQTFAVFCILTLLGGYKGTLSVIVYILLGAVGAPVFAGFSGGIGILIGTTGGYILGFVFIGLMAILAERAMPGNAWIFIGALTVGLLICYAFGTAWFMTVYARRSGPIGIGTALGWCVFPFILPDLAKLALGTLIAQRLRKAIRMA